MGTLMTASAKSRTYLQPTTARNTARQNACLESLASGHVETFIDMFKITEGDSEGAVISESPDLLAAMKDGLMGAENATRKGDLEAVYMAYKRLGDFFEEAEQLQTAKDFRLRAQRAATDLDEPARMVAGHSLLGGLEEKIGDCGVAVTCFEEAFQTATAAGLDRLPPASHLIRSRTALADQLLDKGDAQGAFGHLSSALELATEVDLADLGKECCLRLGKACEVLADPRQGIKYLEKYVNSPSVDQVGKNHACEVLAKCYERIGGQSSNETAVQYLENLVKSATAMSETHPDQLVVAMNAADRLGRLLSRLDRHDASVQRFTEAYDLAKKLNIPANIQAQQVALGAARATAMMSYVARGYVDNTPRDLEVMLRWGSLRHDGFTHGEITTGFEQFDPEASAEARKAMLLEEQRRLARQSVDDKTMRESMLAAAAGAAFAGAGEEKNARRSDIAAFNRNEENAHAVLTGEKSVGNPPVAED